MTTPASHKRRGKTFETDLLRWFRERGYSAERLALAGKDDEGDLVVLDGHHFPHIIEAKAPGESGRINLAGWIKEALTERLNYTRARSLLDGGAGYAVVIKARGKSVDDAYVVVRLADYFRDRSVRRPSGGQVTEPDDDEIEFLNP